MLKPVPYGELERILNNAAHRLMEKQVKKEYEQHGREIFRTQTEKAEPSKKSKSLIEDMKKYIHEHISEDLTAEIVAGALYISPDYLFKIFRKEENMTFVEYLTRERMFYAKEMLKNPELSVSQVAISVGYNNYCYFIKVFKKTFGKTPSEYHRNCVKEAAAHFQESKKIN